MQIQAIFVSITDATDGAWLVMLAMFSLIPAGIIVALAYFIKWYGSRQKDEDHQKTKI